MGKERTACRMLVGEPEGKRLLVRSRRRWKDNIETELKYGVVWTGFVWFRIGNNGGLWLKK
jgi:hypothetical protein